MILKPKSLPTLILASLLSLAATPSAFATVDAIFQHDLISTELQSDDYCYRKVPVWGVYGIQGPVEMKAVFTPYEVPFISYDLSTRKVNLNATATTPPLGFKVTGGDFINAPEFTVTVDTSALARARGNSKEGREWTVTHAKLALLGLTRNLASVSEKSLGKVIYKLFVRFEGLPSQDDLPGTKLPSTTQYPYTAGSPLLKAFEAELMGGGRRCDN